MAILIQVEQASIHTFLLKLHTALKMGYVASLCLSCPSSLDIPVGFFQPRKKTGTINKFYMEMFTCSVLPFLRVSGLLKCTFTFLRLPGSEYET